MPGADGERGIAHRGKAFVGPVWEEFDEVAPVEVILDGDREELCDAASGDAGAYEGLGVGEEEATGGLDGEDLATAVELPFEGAAGYRIAELEADVTIHPRVWRGVRVSRGRTARQR